MVHPTPACSVCAAADPETCNGIYRLSRANVPGNHHFHVPDVPDTPFTWLWTSNFPLRPRVRPSVCESSHQAKVLCVWVGRNWSSYWWGWYLWNGFLLCRCSRSWLRALLHPSSERAEEIFRANNVGVKVPANGAHFEFSQRCDCSRCRRTPALELWVPNPNQANRRGNLARGTHEISTLQQPKSKSIRDRPHKVDHLWLEHTARRSMPCSKQIWGENVGSDWWLDQFESSTDSPETGLLKSWANSDQSISALDLQEEVRRRRWNRNVFVQAHFLIQHPKERKWGPSRGEAFDR